jgi:hypothetical protein
MKLPILPAAPHQIVLVKNMTIPNNNTGRRPMVSETLPKTG